jgi:hypothetical protein
VIEKKGKYERGRTGEQKKDTMVTKFGGKQILGVSSILKAEILR